MIPGSNPSGLTIQIMLFMSFFAKNSNYFNNVNEELKIICFVRYLQEVVCSVPDFLS